MRKVLAVLYWIIAVLPLIIGISIIDSLPDQIPAHYDISGEVDRWGSKSEIFILPILSIFLSGIFYLIMMIQIKQKKSKGHERALQITLFILPVTFLLIFIMMSVSAFQSIENLYEFPFIKIFVIVFGQLFSAIGFAMPNIKMNGLFGIRTPRTLQSEEVWQKTHRFGGKVWVVGGLLIAIIALFLGNESSMFVLLGGLLFLTIIPVVYSYRIEK